MYALFQIISQLINLKPYGCSSRLNQQLEHVRPVPPSKPHPIPGHQHFGVTRKKKTFFTLSLSLSHLRMRTHFVGAYEGMTWLRHVDPGSCWTCLAKNMEHVSDIQAHLGQGRGLVSFAFQAMHVF